MSRKGHANARYNVTFCSMLNIYIEPHSIICLGQEVFQYVWPKVYFFLQPNPNLRGPNLFHITILELMESSKWVVFSCSRCFAVNILALQIYTACYFLIKYAQSCRIKLLFKFPAKQNGHSFLTINNNIIHWNIFVFSKNWASFTKINFFSANLWPIPNTLDVVSQPRIARTYSVT